MTTRLSLVVLCGAMAILCEPRLSPAALVNSAASEAIAPVRQPPRKPPARRVAVPASPMLTEAQALHSLETEISRKVGLQMSEADYPEEARRWAWRGITLVHVLVGKDGLMRSISVSRSSGFRILDEQALRVVGRVSAPSWIPDRLRGRDIAVLVPIGFILPQHQ